MLEAELFNLLGERSRTTNRPDSPQVGAAPEDSGTAGYGGITSISASLTQPVTQKSRRRSRPVSRWRETPRLSLYPWQHGHWTARRRRFALEVTLVRNGTLVARVYRQLAGGGWGCVERQEWAAGTLCEVARRWAEQQADELAAFRGLFGGSH